MKFAVILPYFGKLPNYFNLWIQSMSYNKELDFFLFTDNELKNEYDNFHIIHMSFDEIVTLINDKIDCKIKLKSPYKLCDFKPAYGLIFEDYIKGYDYWAHSDPDLIFGDIYKFIKKPAEEGYDRIFNRGHLSFYKNNDKMNHLFMQSSKEFGVTYKDIFKTNYICHFDEGPFLDQLIKEASCKYYRVVTFADVLYAKYQFNICNYESEEDAYIFKFNKGTLNGYFLKDGVINEREFCYVHLQKRKMNMKTENKNCYYIVPNAFVDGPKSVDKTFIKTYTMHSDVYEKEFKKVDFKIRVDNVKNGAILYRLKNYLK